MQGLSAHAHAVVSCLLGKGGEHDRAHPADADAGADDAVAAASEGAARRRLACACEMVWGGLPGGRLLQLEHLASALVARLHAGIAGGSQVAGGSTPGATGPCTVPRLGCALRCLDHLLLESPGMRCQLAAFVDSFGAEAEAEAEAEAVGAVGAVGTSADDGKTHPPGGQAADARLRAEVRARLETRHGTLDGAAVVEEAGWCFDAAHAARMEQMTRRAPDPAAFAGGGIAPSVYSSLCARLLPTTYYPRPTTHYTLPAIYYSLLPT